MLLYPENIKEKLEFDKLTEMVSSYCRSACGRKIASQISIETDFNTINQALQLVHEYTVLKRADAYLPNDFISPLEKELALLGIQNAMLTASQLQLIVKLCNNTASIFRFFQINDTIYPTLQALTKHIHYEKKIADIINEVINEFGGIKDTASKELFQIRNKLSKKRQELNRVFSRIVQKMQKDGVLADIEHSFINGRKMIVVQSEFKRQVGGIIHGESSTGQSSFIEPKETVELNNDIFELEREEEREVYKILNELTAKLSAYKHLIQSYYWLSGEYDFIHAKARIAIELNASKPMLSNKPVLKLRKAFHPLLYLYHKRAGKEVVPVDLELNRDGRILIISGPNAGGKTICLKTVVLLQMMLQSGLLVPASEISEMGIFNSLMIDIGDAQSIEYELSTYSSHLKTLKYFIDYADPHTLFCIDELGTGTDPALGGAFAEVVLEELASKKALGVVTTHYLNLKVMANKVQGIINGAMMFDEEHLQPLYKLILGKPGSSYTFSIAKRSGLPQRMIDKAKTLVHEDHFHFDDLLLKIEQEQMRTKELTAQISEKDKHIRVLESKLNELAQKHQRQAQQVQHIQQKKTSSPFLKQAEKELRKLLIEWNKQKHDESLASKTAQQLERLNPSPKPKPSTATVNEKSKHKPIQEQPKPKPIPLQVGSNVMVKNFTRPGVIQSINGKRVNVLIDAMKLTVNVSDVEVI